MAKPKTYDELRGSTPDVLEHRLEEITNEALDALEGKLSISRQEAAELRAERAAIKAELARRERELSKSSGWSPDD